MQQAQANPRLFVKKQKSLSVVNNSTGVTLRDFNIHDNPWWGVDYSKAELKMAKHTWGWALKEDKPKIELPLEWGPESL